jgi:hypothetical protein
LYPTTLLKLFILCRSFWVEFFGSLRCKIMLSSNSDSLNISLHTHIYFISSSGLIALARNSKTMLNSSGRVGTQSFSWL